MTGAPGTIEEVSSLEVPLYIAFLSIDAYDTTFVKIKRINKHTSWFFSANSVLDVTLCIGIAVN